MEDPAPGIYRHFKGRDYFVIGTARRPYLAERLVVYRALYDEHLDFVRPLEMFLEDINRDGYHGPRFKLINDEQGFLQAFGLLRADETFLPAIHSETREKFAVHRGLFGEQDLIALPLSELVRKVEDFRFKL